MRANNAEVSAVIFRRLEQYAIAGRKSSGQRRHGEEDRIVPRDNNPDHAKGLRQNPSLGGL